MFAGKELTASVEARVDLIENEDGSVGVAEFAKQAQKSRRRHDLAPTAQDGLHQHGSGILAFERPAHPSGQFVQLRVPDRERKDDAQFLQLTRKGSAESLHASH